jgi:hypothetical protein
MKLELGHYRYIVEAETSIRYSLHVKQQRAHPMEELKKLQQSPPFQMKKLVIAHLQVNLLHLLWHSMCHFHIDHNQPDHQR